MTTLSRRILQEISLTFTFNFLALTTFTSLILSRRFLREEIPLSHLFEILPLILVSSSSFSLPLTSIVSAAQVTSRWKQDGEIFAFLSGSLSLRALFFPFLFFYLALTCIVTPLNHTWVPQAREILRTQAESLLQQVFLAKMQTGLPLVLSTHERLFTNGFDGEWMNNLTYTYYKDEEIHIIHARRGKIISQEDQLVLNCHEVHIDNLEKKRNLSLDLETHDIPLKDTSSKKFRDIDSSMTRLTSQLGASTEDKIEKSSRWVFIFLVPLFALLGFKLGLIIPWSSKIAAFSLSLLPVLLVFYPSFMLCRSKAALGDWSGESVWASLLPLIILNLMFNRPLKKSGY